MNRRKQQLCRMCKKNPVWRGGDVKEPGPYCKRCYHKHVWPARRGRRQNGSESNEPSSDYLLDAANEHWPYILTAYKQFADKRPVMLFDIQEKRIYAYPCADFSRELSEQSQQTLKDQYERALRDNKIVVFVRDNIQRRLVSFSLDYQ